MVYTILISVVFVAELIIVVTIIQNLLKLDKYILNLDDSILSTRDGIKDICELSRKISEQYVILVSDFVDRTKRNSEDILLKNLSKTILSIVLLKLNFKFINKIRKSKLSKIISKGYSFVESMI